MKSSRFSNESVQQSVRQILNKVKQDGDGALKFYTFKFDKIELDKSGFFPFPKYKIKESYIRVSKEFKSALLFAAKRIELFHREELKQLTPSWSKMIDGVVIGQKRMPLSKIGIYIPGGRTIYPSTILMTVIPALVAGVKEIILTTPPHNLKDEVLATAHILGVNRLYGVGGVQAIAAMAYGTQTLPRVDKIFGPGNAYVLEAKRQLFGTVGIDCLAGPSEVAVWADRDCEVQKIVLNLLAQAEHDPGATSTLLTTDRNLSKAIEKEIPEIYSSQVRFVIRKDAGAILSEINDLAPEHLWLAIKKPRSVLSQIKNAGAIFLGYETPVALGDYVAGPSHVLPTGGAARFSSGLSVKDFFKWSSVIETKSKKITDLLEASRILASAENLEYHYRSLKGMSDDKKKMFCY